MKLSKLFYAWLTAICINTTVFVPSLFIFNYTSSVEHWSAGAWEAIVISSGLIKVCFWLVGIAGGICDKKFFIETEEEKK